MKRGVLLVAALAALCGCGSKSALVNAPVYPPSTTARAETSAPVCNAHPVSGNHRLHVVAGQPRVLFHVPTRRLPGQSLPLVLGLHGHHQTGPEFAQMTGFSKLADSQRFVVAYPTHTGKMWNYPDPDGSGLKLLKQTIADASKLACIDPKRIYVTGFSRGGREAFAAACDLPDVAAIATVAAVADALPPCKPGHAVSVLDIHGTADSIVHYRDGVRAAIDAWAKREECPATPNRSKLEPTVTRLVWTGCRSGAEVQHVRIAGAAHDWPPLAGPRGTRYDAATRAWRFFKGIRLAQ